MASVKTPIGELKCYMNDGGKDAGISIYFVPEGSEEEINIAMIQASEEKKLTAYIKEQYVDILPY